MTKRLPILEVLPSCTGVILVTIAADTTTSAGSVGVVAGHTGTFGRYQGTQYPTSRACAPGSLEVGLGPKVIMSRVAAEAKVAGPRAFMTDDALS